jgi:hypothetical protein
MEISRFPARRGRAGVSVLLEIGERQRVDALIKILS